LRWLSEDSAKVGKKKRGGVRREIWLSDHKTPKHSSRGAKVPVPVTDKPKVREPGYLQVGRGRQKCPSGGPEETADQE